jgi:hypothetical protein
MPWTIRSKSAGACIIQNRSTTSSPKPEQRKAAMQPPDLTPIDNAPPSTATPAKKLNMLERFLVAIVGVDQSILTTRCRPQDVSTITAQGGLLVGGIALTTSILILISHKILGQPGHLEPELVLGSIAIGGLVGLIDAFVFYRASWCDAGIKVLAEWGGLDIRKGANDFVAWILKFVVRLALSLPLALLCGIYLGIFTYERDIRSITELNYLNANSVQFAQAESSTDEIIGHVAQSVKVKEAEINALSGQLTSLRSNAFDDTKSVLDQNAQNEINSLLSQKASAEDDVRRSESTEALELGGVIGPRTSGLPGNGPRHRAALQEVENAKAHAHQIDDALAAARSRAEALRDKTASASETARQRAEQGMPAFEEKLRQSNVELAKLREQLDDLTQRRNEIIRKTVETSPSRVDYNDGPLAEIIALGELGRKDSKVAMTILLFELATIALELAAVCSKALVQIPTDYATIVARDAILHSIKIADEMMVEMNSGPNTEAVPLENPIIGSPAKDNISSANGNNKKVGPIIDVEPSAKSDSPDPPQPPKRGRGRPRKTKPNLLN